MPVEIKNLSIKVQVHGNASQIRNDADDLTSEWTQEELTELIEKSLNNKKER
ncbi:hypothetical protein GCM10022393_27080 [Aquimarina addita]|uniref:Uncharacterized protein n=1 Tax=Aquimarina addita TaxID=870485 RepID=A0ABP6UN39_9FLAO